MKTVILACVLLYLLIGFLGGLATAPALVRRSARWTEFRRLVAVTHVARYQKKRWLQTAYVLMLGQLLLLNTVFWPFHPSLDGKH